jgi:hypothetical protein
MDIMMNLFRRLCSWFLALAIVAAMASNAAHAEPTLAEVCQQRYDAAHKPRRLIYHSDGVAMDPKYAYHEPTPSVIPHLPGTQVEGCTYSLIHQFPVVRLYRTKAGQEWPAGITEKLFGDGPDGLDQYIKFCHDNGYEAFWAMRTNDTHDSARDAHGQSRWDSNLWKQQHPEFLFGTREKGPRFGGWTAFDYARPEVRDKVLEVVTEVGENYPIDGMLLDFFRHLPTFKSTAWGAKQASDEEREALTDLMRRIRDMRDKVGAERGKPLLLAIRTPDTPEYCRALGIDLEKWMEEGLFDIWIATGYFRLQEWDDIVALSHRHDVPVWASIDDSRVNGRENRNSLEAFRARIMNVRRAGVDSVWIFNYFHFPKDREFQLLNEAGSIESLAFSDKVYVPDDLGQDMAWRYLPGGGDYYKRSLTFDPQFPAKLAAGAVCEVELRVGDDLSAAAKDGHDAQVALRLQGDGFEDDLQVAMNEQELKSTTQQDGWIEFAVDPAQVKLGVNQVRIGRTGSSASETTLKDLQLAIDYSSTAGTDR